MRFILLTFGAILTLLSWGQFPNTIATEKVYVSTDKYYYENSENIDFAVFISTDSSFHPISTRVKVWLENAQGQILDSVFIYTSDTYRCGFLNRQSKGGQYFIKAQSAHQLNYTIPKVYSKEIFVQQYQKTSFLINLQTDRDNYFGFDSVDITAKIITATDKNLLGLPVNLSLIANGETLKSFQAIANEDGIARAKIPIDIATAKNLQWKAACSFEGKSYTQIKTIKLKPEKIIASVYYKHGSDGWISGHSNELVVATTDQYGNPFDVSGELRNATTSIPYKSIAKGLAAITFNPKAGETWTLSCNDQDQLELSPASKPVGIGKNKHTFFIIGDFHKGYEITFSGRDKVFKRQKISEMETVSYQHQLPGAYCVTLSLNDTVVAQRVFLNKPASESLDLSKIKEEYAKSDFRKLELQSFNKKAFYGSLSLVDINAFNQIEDKSHHVETWLLLGSEFNTYIDEPQFYFNNDKSSTKCLDLLLTTLTSAYSRDWETGKTKAIESHRYLSKMEISGTIYDLKDGYYYNNGLKKAKVQIKNTNIISYTDSLGKFTLTIPASIQAPFTLVVTKWGEVATLEVTSLANLRSVDVTFATQKSDLVLSNENFNNLTKIKIFDNQKPISFLGSRADGTAYFVDGVRVVGSSNQASYSSADISRLPTRSINSIAAMSSSAVSYYYSYHPNNHIYNGFAFPSSYYRYIAPYRIQLDYKRVRPPTSSPVQYNKNTTAYWNATLRSTTNGKVDINLNGSINGGLYKLIVEGVDELGNPVYGTQEIKVLEELSIDVAIPENLRIGDEAYLPYTITNNTDKEQKVFVNWRFKQNLLDTILLQPKQTLNAHYSITGLGAEEKLYCNVHFSTAAFSKRIGKVINVATDREVMRAILSGDHTNTTMVDLSAAEMSSVSANFEVFPIFSERIIEVSKNLVRQPSGCFEQVSSSNYPNLMVYKLLKATNSKNVDLLKRTENYIRSGYQKLVNYQTPLGGFEWYGKVPPHQALTAYGLLQFGVMQDLGISIDQQMFNYNLKWLWNQRDNKGGFKNNRGKYGFRAAPYETNNAYITWVLSRVSSYNLEEQQKAIEDASEERI
jgi:hypothetical protein